MQSILARHAHARELLPDPKAVLDETWRGAVSELFMANAARAPAKLAVTDAHDRWSYAELDARANQLAHWLLAAGCERGERVAIVAHRSASLAWAVLAVMKAAAAFVMIDPAYPPERIVAILDASGARALIRIAEGPALEPKRPAPGSRAQSCARASICLARARSAAVRIAAPDGTGRPDSARRIWRTRFTSGSTGKPKGVLGRHGPLTHFNRGCEGVRAHRNIASR